MLREYALKYLLMVRSEPAAWDQWTSPTPEFEATVAFMDKLNKELTELGEMVDGAGLGAPAKGKTVRKSGGRTTVVDGPFAEAKEVLGGYWVLECDEQRAIEVAERVVAFEGGPNTIEIREIAG